MSKEFRIDLIAGTTTFFTMAYIFVVNPAILSTPGTGLSFTAVMTATVLLASSMTLLMGLYAKLPFGVAPGMGINAFFTYGLILGQKVPAMVALGMVFWAGILFLLISITPLRVWVAEAIPANLRVGAAAGIGLFLTFIGMQHAGWVVADPVTLVKFGKFDEKSLLAVLGLVVAIGLMRRRSPFAFLASMGVVTLIAWLRGDVQIPASIVSAPDFSLFLKMDPMGALSLKYIPSMLSILFTDLFDSLATFVGVAYATGLLDKKGRPMNLRQGLLVDAFATLFGGVLGTSSGTAYIESASGIELGGRRGRSAVVTGLWMLPCLFIAPMAGMVPKFATAPILVIVGVLMFRTVSSCDWNGKLEEVVPPFLTMVLIPMTFSITQGILWGFVSHVLLYVLAGRAKDVSKTMYGIAIISVALWIIENNR